MSDRLAAQPRKATDVVARAVGAVALGTLALIHVVDLPGTLGPLPLVGAGYLGIIGAAVIVGGMMIARSRRLVWAAAGGLAAAAMGGYVLTRTVGGFLGDHGDVGNWRCSLGLAALGVETLLILLAVWQARSRTTPRSLPARPVSHRIPEFSRLG
jgi:MFS family permease